MKLPTKSPIREFYNYKRRWGLWRCFSKMKGPIAKKFRITRMERFTFSLSFLVKQTNESSIRSTEVSKFTLEAFQETYFTCEIPPRISTFHCKHMWGLSQSSRSRTPKSLLFLCATSNQWKRTPGTSGITARIIRKFVMQFSSWKSDRNAIKPKEVQ